MKLTKLERLLAADDRGVSSGNGALAKIYRSFWKAIGLSHQHMATLIDAWLDDPNQEFEQDQKSINNSRGNLRKDSEKDELTWKIFTRNLRVLRPQEVRFLVRIKFKNGATFRQIAFMRPPNSSKYNSDFLFEKQGRDPNEEIWQMGNAEEFDDEGFHKSEKEYDDSDAKMIESLLKDLRKAGYSDEVIEEYAPRLFTK